MTKNATIALIIILTLCHVVRCFGGDLEYYFVQPQHQPRQMPMVVAPPPPVYTPYYHRGHVVYVNEPYVQNYIQVRDPVIMPYPGTEVLHARPATVEYYDQRALIERGRKILQWNNGFPNEQGYRPHWDPRLSGHNDPGVAFPRIRHARDMYGDRW